MSQGSILHKLVDGRIASTQTAAAGARQSQTLCLEGEWPLTSHASHSLFIVKKINFFQRLIQQASI